MNLLLGVQVIHVRHYFMYYGMKWLRIDQDVEDRQALCDGECWEAHRGSLMLKFHRYNELAGAPQFILV